MEPNDRLRAAREACASPSVPGEAMSRAELAEAVNAHLWRTTGRRYGLDAHAIARYERGKVRWPGAAYRAGLKAVLGVENDAELGFRSTPRGGNAAASVGASEIQEEAQQGWASDGRASAEPRNSLPVPPRVAEAWDVDRSSPGFADSMREFAGEANSTQEAAETVRAFRVADRRVGGGYLYMAVQQYSASLLGPRLGVATTGDAVFCAAAGVTEMSGWMAHDAGWDHLAAQHFRRAYQLARVGDDTPLAAQIMASRSHLALHAGYVDDARYWAEAGWQLLEGREDGAVRLRLLAMRARAAARMGEGNKFRELLRQAERLPEAEGTGASSSPWTSPFDEGSLAGEASRGLCELGDFSAGLDHAHRVLELRSAERPRARALARLVSATALTGRGEIDDACAQVQEVGATIGGIGSRVLAQRFEAAVGYLRCFDSSRLVGQALPALEAVVTHTRRQLHWLGAHEQGGWGGRGL